MTELSVSTTAAGHVPQVPLPEAPPKVTVRNLNFYYGEHHALKNINLTLGTNRVTAFIGPSGCGKSTLLRIFNRMYDLYPGQRAVGQLMLDQTNILDPKLDLNPGRHGVPEADAVPDDDLREHRLRHSPL
jgi:phosphate transport system ATP-binding protein